MSDKIKKKFSENQRKNMGKKESNKSDTFTEEDDVEEAESKPKQGGSPSENSPANASSERRSSRIMTRRQRDSELREQFARKLKTTAGKIATKKELPKKLGTSDLNTSDSETPTPAKKAAVSKPVLLANKRKSSLEYNKSRKLIRLEADTTTDDNEETMSKRKNSIEFIKKRKQSRLEAETTTDDNEDTEEGDYKQTNTAKRKPNQISKLVKRMKDDFSDETDDTSETDEESDSDSSDLEKSIKKAIVTKFSSLKAVNSNSVNHSQPRLGLDKKPTPRPGVASVKKPVALPQKAPLNRPVRSDVISNVSNVKTFASNSNSKQVDSLKFCSPKGETSAAAKLLNRQVNSVQTSPALASPKIKSEFDKLVDELFQHESTKKQSESKKPEIMLIDNEPTDVYTLSIDDTLDEEDDLENLESLCEEVYEDDIEPPRLASPVRLNSSVGSKTKMNTSQHAVSNVPCIKKELAPVATRPNKPLVNNSVKQIQIQPLTKTLIIPKTPCSAQTPSSAQKSTPAKPSVSEPSGEYREKYTKLLTSYEALSKKIAQYMERTRKEKEQLLRQLRIERSRCGKARDDLEDLKKKFQYLMKNKPSLKKK